MLSIYGMYSIFNLEKTNVCACVIYIYTKSGQKYLFIFMRGFLSSQTLRRLMQNRGIGIGVGSSTSVMKVCTPLSKAKAGRLITIMLSIAQIL